MVNKYNKDKLKSVGQNYQKARIANGITQEEVAEELDLSPSYISDIERGKTFGSIHTLISLCNLYKVAPNDILFPLVESDINLTNPYLIGFNSLSQTNQEIIGEMIRILNAKKTENND